MAGRFDFGHYINTIFVAVAKEFNEFTTRYIAISSAFGCIWVAVAGKYLYQMIFFVKCVATA